MENTAVIGSLPSELRIISTSGSQSSFENGTTHSDEFDGLSFDRAFSETGSVNSEDSVMNVGRYQLIRRIGFGSFSEVWKARHIDSGKCYAVKIARTKRSKQSQKSRAEVMLLHEAHLLRTLSHPRIIQLHHVMRSRDALYVVVDLCENGTLNDRLENSPSGYLSEDVVCRYASQLLGAVKRCHEVGVFHRDLKLENVMLDEFDNVKLLDFGMAIREPKAIRQRQELWSACLGTPAFMAPELLSNMNTYRKSVQHWDKPDVWSFGVMLYKLLVGKQPYTGRSMEELEEQINFQRIHYPAHLSAQVVAVLKLMLKRDPEERPSLEVLQQSEWWIQEEIEITDDKHVLKVELNETRDPNSVLSSYMRMSSTTNDASVADVIAPEDDRIGNRILERSSSTMDFKSESIQQKHLNKSPSLLFHSLCILGSG
eukprot:CAMPEP_0182445426 /NCGR_PEP_ID=MMETSP1172-20130603/3553_1 /TAXON_ID=708627 /ORGANISM="Timspurckia oligopyrenoides, Strain CCMP3278" /LENGTH=426 /DNA_ID=CAMNT_0024641199 /DNA_START=282 /DNA_END=1562 /DNA_ORIENTATION=+